MPRPTRWAAAAIYGGPTRLCRHLSVGPRYIAAAHTCAEVWRRCGAPAEAQRGNPQGVRRIRKAAKRTIWSLRRRCHAAGWAHGRVAKSGLREKCRSGLCPSPVFSSAPCLSSPTRLPSALLAVTLRVGRMAGSLSPGSAKNAAPGCARRLFFRLRPALAPLCAYPPRFFAVTLRLFATPGFPPTPGTNGQFANWPGLYPSLQSIRAAHDGSALLFILPEFSPPGQPWRTPCA